MNIGTVGGGPPHPADLGPQVEAGALAPLFGGPVK
jgi:hypothetical protein